jgi:hypothetical protein
VFWKRRPPDCNFKAGGGLELVVVSGGEGGYVGMVSSLLSR